MVILDRHRLQFAVHVVNEYAHLSWTEPPLKMLQIMFWHETDIQQSERAWASRIGKFSVNVLDWAEVFLFCKLEEGTNASGWGAWAFHKPGKIT